MEQFFNGFIFIYLVIKQSNLRERFLGGLLTKVIELIINTLFCYF
jgi:hypothetical protein